MKIYIAGPMAGLPGMNFEAFNQKDYELKLLGHETVNPVDIGEKFFNNSPSVHPTKFLKMDIIELLSCDAICLLPGWLDSRGARIEAAIAKMMGFAFFDGVTNQPMSPPEKVCITRDYHDWHFPEHPNGT